MIKYDGAWIIVNKDLGAYFGTYSSRRGAIGSHVNALDTECYVACNGLMEHRGWEKLSPLQITAWKRCRANGDRAVYAQLRWSM